MLDREMTAARPRPKRGGPAREAAREASRPCRRPARTDDDGFGRREVVVQGMRITLPALRFMERPAPSPRGR